MQAMARRAGSEPVAAARQAPFLGVSPRVMALSIVAQPQIGLQGLAPGTRVPAQAPNPAAATVAEGPPAVGVAEPGERGVTQQLGEPDVAVTAAASGAQGMPTAAATGVATPGQAAAPSAADSAAPSPDPAVAKKQAAEGTAAPSAPKEEAPTPPSPREAMAPAIGAIKQRAKTASTHTPAPTTVASARAAALQPDTEQKRSATTATVGNLDAAKDGSKKVERESFKSALKKAIEAATPKPTTEAQANEVVKGGAKAASATMQGQLATQTDAAVGPMKDPAAAEVPPGSQPAPPVTALKPEEVGPPPAPVSAAPVVPPPLPAQRLDYSADRAPADTAMAENNITKAQLEKGNEPAFGQTLEARSAAEQHEAQAEAKYRKDEATVHKDAKGQAHGALAEGLGGVHGARAAAIGNVVGQQTGTKTKEQAERKRITDTIDGIKTTTRTAVESILKEMDTEANRIFGEGLTAAEAAYRATFDEEMGGVGTWLTTWGDDWKELVESSLGTARREYLHHVDLAIDKVADCVDAKLDAAKQRVTQGRTEVENFVSTLDSTVKGYGEEALATVSADFDAMTSMIDERKDALIDSLTSQFKASYERMSEMEEELRNANKSLWERVYDATVGVIKKIIAFKDMLLSVLAKAANVVTDIISDPIGFLGNLASGVMLGLKNFMGKIGAHLKKGLLDWLFGALGGAGLVMPDTLDLKGIVSIVLQVLGLTYANFRARAVNIVGEPIVSALEKAAEVFKVIVAEGIPGLWRFIKEKVADFKEMVLDAIFDFIKEKVIVAGITWVIGLLNPASAFFKACKAIYDIVMFFIERGSQILELVNAVIDSMAAIAKGSIGVAATFVENALAKAIPVAIGFLAGLLGLGDISGTIRKTIDKAQAPTNKAIDWVIHQAVKLVKAAGKLIAGAFGKKDKSKKDAEPDDSDPEKAAKVEAGLAAIDAEEQNRIRDGGLTQEAAEEVAGNVKKAHPVFKSITVVDGKERWDYHYVASPGETKTGELKAEDDGILYISVINSKEPILSDVGDVSVGMGDASPSTFETEVGKRLAETTSLRIQKGGKTKEDLRTEGVTKTTPVARPVLLEQPKITPPSYPTSELIAHHRPDFLLLTPNKVEVFEVTLDANFEIPKHEKGLRHSAGAERYGDPHKIIQLGKVPYLAKRFPNVPIVYNIQTRGKPSKAILERLERILRDIREEIANANLANPVQIVWRS